MSGQPRPGYVDDVSAAEKSIVPGLQLMNLDAPEIHGELCHDCTTGDRLEHATITSKGTLTLFHWTVVVTDATITPMNDNKQIVQRFWDGLAARDWDAMKALLTDDAHYTDVGVPGPGGIGPEGVIRRLRIGIEPLEDYTHLPGTNMIGEGNFVMTEHTERWTFHTGEVIEHSFVSVTELEDGKICRWHDYSNISNITDNAPNWWLEHIMNEAAAE